MDQYDVIVIGQGYAGLTFAKGAAARGLRVLNIEENCMGGLILNINELDPAPQGAAHNGSELSSGLAMDNMDSGIDMPTESVTAIEPNGDEWIVSADSGSSYNARHVIIASGAKLKKLGIPGEQEFFGKGVSECADCDGPMFRGMDTVIVGGGDSAFQEAAALAAFAKSVTILMRGASPRARQELQQAVAALANVKQVFGTQIVAIEGDPTTGVESIRVRSQEDSESSMPTGGVFIFIGLQPNTTFAPEEIERDSTSALKTAADGSTSAKGIWVIGAARSGFGGLLSHADEDVTRTLAALE